MILVQSQLRNHFPALFIIMTILSFNILGDALRDVLDPKLKL